MRNLGFSRYGVCHCTDHGPFQCLELLQPTEWDRGLPLLRARLEETGGFGIIEVDTLDGRRVRPRPFVHMKGDWIRTSTDEEADYVITETEEYSTQVFMDGEVWDMVIRKEWQWFDEQVWSEDYPDAYPDKMDTMDTSEKYAVYFYRVNDASTQVNASQIFLTDEVEEAKQYLGRNG